MNNMKIYQKTFFQSIFLIFVMSYLFLGEAFAKKAIGYTPPPYYARLLISLFTLAPNGLLVSIVCYFILRFIDRDNCIKNKSWFFFTVIVLIFCGAFTATSDSYNDELWNPAMIGSLSLSMIIPAAIMILQKRLRLRAKIVISLVSILPSIAIFEFITYWYQMFGFSIGLPTTW